MIQFWFLWVFITLVVVIVALTLRKEREEMPRKDILRAVETSASSMGLAEKTFLWAFSWLDTRFRIQDYWGMSRDAYYGMHRQMPMTHAEKYKLRIIWYWYPLYCLGDLFPRVCNSCDYWYRPRTVLCPRRRGGSNSCVQQYGVHHDPTPIRIHH